MGRALWRSRPGLRHCPRGGPSPPGEAPGTPTRSVSGNGPGEWVCSGSKGSRRFLPPQCGRPRCHPISAPPGMFFLGRQVGRGNAAVTTSPGGRPGEVALLPDLRSHVLPSLCLVAVRFRPCHLSPANHPSPPWSVSSGRTGLPPRRPLVPLRPAAWQESTAGCPARGQLQSDLGQATGQVAKRVHGSLLGLPAWNVPGQPPRSQRAAAWEMLLAASSRC